MSNPRPRQDFADELRGFALLGIVLVNAPFLGLSGQGFTEASVAGWADRVAALSIVALAYGKFYLLFAFLFGYSMSFMVRDEQLQSLVRFRRRLLVLGVLGVLHAAFMFVGDILLLYAVLACALLVIHRWSDAALVRFAVASGLLWLVLMGLLLLASTGTIEGDRPVAQLAGFDAAMAQGSFQQASLARLAFWPLPFISISVLNGLPVLAMFALGLLAARQKLLAKPEGFERIWALGRCWGTWLGLPLACCSAWLQVGPGALIGANGGRETFGLVLGFVSAPLLSWAYVAWLLLWRTKWPGALAWFRPAGRMSLSGYLGESLLLSLVFCAYGLGLYGQLGAAAVAGIAILVWFLLELMAHFAQRFTTQGPLELLVRRLTGA
jgi:uncharacterized protein